MCVCGSHNHLETFPQSKVNSSSTIFCCMPVIYASVGLSINPFTAEDAIWRPGGITHLSITS